MAGTVARSTPYAWPYDGRLEPARLALLVLLPGGGAGPGGGGPALDPLVERISLLAGATRGSGGVVVEVTAAPRSRGQNGSRPARQAPDSPWLRGDTRRVPAGGIDGFFASGLDALLRRLGRDQLLLCGQWLETNVHSTMRSANDRGYECLLVLDACVPVDPALIPAARSQIEMSGGIFGAVGETAAVLDALLPHPEPPHQKDVTAR